MRYFEFHPFDKRKSDTHINVRNTYHIIIFSGGFMIKHSHLEVI